LIGVRQQLARGGEPLIHDETVRRDAETVLEQPKEMEPTDTGRRRQVVQANVFSQPLLNDIENAGLLRRRQ
jgi:hypothetical protein